MPEKGFQFLKVHFLFIQYLQCAMALLKRERRSVPVSSLHFKIWCRGARKGEKGGGGEQVFLLVNRGLIQFGSHYILHFLTWVTWVPHPDFQSYAGSKFHAGNTVPTCPGVWFGSGPQCLRKRASSLSNAIVWTWNHLGSTICPTGETNVSPIRTHAATNVATVSPRVLSGQENGPMGGWEGRLNPILPTCLGTELPAGNQ